MQPNCTIQSIQILQRLWFTMKGCSCNQTNSLTHIQMMCVCPTWECWEQNRKNSSWLSLCVCVADCFAVPHLSLLSISMQPSSQLCIYAWRCWTCVFVWGGGIKVEIQMLLHFYSPSFHFFFFNPSSSPTENHLYTRSPQQANVNVCLLSQVAAWPHICPCASLAWRWLEWVQLLWKSANPF